MNKKGRGRGKSQGKKYKPFKERQIDKQKKNVSDPTTDQIGEQSPLVHSSNTDQVVNISQQTVPQQQDNIIKEIKDVWGRGSWFTLILLLLCAISTILIFNIVLPITILTIIISLSFAAFLTIISTFFNQHRFHYRYLIMNESVSRFISVLASSLLTKIIKFGENSYVQTNLILPCAFFFLLAIVFYALSVIFTNGFKEYLHERHTCNQKTKEYEGKPVLETEGINQKLCANTEDSAWIELKKSLDSKTNRNIQLFLGFYFFTILLLVYLQYYANSIPPLILPSTQ